MRDVGLIPELGRFPGGGLGNPLQDSCLENPVGRLQSIVLHSPTWLKWLSTHTHTHTHAYMWIPALPLISRITSDKLLIFSEVLSPNVECCIFIFSLCRCMGNFCSEITFGPRVKVPSDKLRAVSCPTLCCVESEVQHSGLSLTGTSSIFHHHRAITGDP